MSAMTTHQLPFHLRNVGKRDVRSQFGALCYRVVDGKVKILLVTSRGRGRWIIPKGWPLHRATPAEAAANEAYEEAGVRTRTTDSVIGFFTYLKVQGGRKMSVVVAVFPSEVTQELPHWPEKGQRRRKWVGRKKAAKMVDAPELAAIIRNFDPSKL
ncbi:NUDIX domain-containing protein [Maritimibacter sp. DP07]|uniref:NUDIX domain-containing protein n=2 Tax=Maritimibacter harenae TaxID=2606218 RepID=A0A845LVA1_9RHOB|nr:NUDIX domain-containing protein [Maritimibacter harenae]